MLLGIDGHLLDLPGQVNEGHVLNPGAARAGDDIQPLAPVLGNSTKAPRPDVLKNLVPGLDLLCLPVIRQGQGNPDRVTNPDCNELVKGDPGLDDPIGRQAGLGHPQVQGNIRPLSGEETIGLDNLLRVRVLERDDEAGKPEIVEVGAMINGATHHRSDPILWIFFLVGRIHGAAVDPHPERAVVLRCHRGDELHLVPHRLVFLYMVKMAGVVAHLVNMGSHLGHEAVVLLQVNHEVGIGPLANLGKGPGIFLVVTGQADNVRPCFSHISDLRQGLIDFLRMCRRHGLNGDAMLAADLDRPYPYRACWITLDLLGHKLVRILKAGPSGRKRGAQKGVIVVIPPAAVNESTSSSPPDSGSLLDLTGLFLYACLSMNLSQLIPRLILAAASWLLLPLPGQSMAGEKENPVIDRVEFPGRSWLPQEELLKTSGLKPGKKWTPEAGRRAVENLLKHKFIESVALPRVSSAAGKPTVIRIQIVELPLLGEIRIRGNSALARQKLREALGCEEGAPFRQEMLEDSKEDLEQACQEDGFLFAKVDAEARTLGPGRMGLYFDITEGDRASIREVITIGNSELTRDEIIEISGLRPERIFGVVQKGYFVPHKLGDSLEKLRLFYRSRGNLDSKVGLKDISINSSLRDVRITLEVREGPRYRLQELRFEGNQIFGDKILSESIEFEPGRFYSGSTVEELRRSLVRIYQERSDRIPAVAAQLLYTGETELAVVFKIDEREHLFVRKVEISGNTRTRDRVIRRHSSLISGEPLSLIEMDDTLKRLRATGLFSDVSLSATDTGVPGRKDLKIEVEERDTVGRWDIGGGASSGEGEVGYFRLEHTNFDLFALPKSLGDWSNAFVGGGQSIYTEIIPGNVESRYTFGFHEPYFFSTSRALTMRAGSQIFRRGSYDENRFTIEPEIRQYLDSEHQLSLSLGWRLDDVRIDEVDPGAPGAISTAQGDALLSYPRLSLRYLDLENNSYGGPQGVLAECKLDLADSLTGSDNDFTRCTISADYYKPLFDRYADLRHLLHLGVEAGWINSSAGDLPFYENFFLGGPHNFRGFEYRELGPHDLGEPIGGGSLLRGTVEYSAPLLSREIRGLVLFDWGLLEDDISDFSGSRIRTAAGAGFQFRFPFLGQVLPVNLYWTKALSKMQGDQPEVFSFTLGYTF